jgi:hypothetical protein
MFALSSRFGALASSPARRSPPSVAQAEQLTLGRPSVVGIPPHEAVAITVASGQSSLQAFRLGCGVASGLGRGSCAARFARSR